MKARLVPLALGTVLLLALGSLAACGDDSLTVQGYFQQLERLSGDFDERGEALADQYEGDIDAAESEEEAIEIYQEFFDTALPIFEDLVDGIRGLNPPAALEDAHNEGLKAGEDAVAAFKDLVEQLKDVESEAEAEGLVEGFFTGQAATRFDETCAALQDIADENEVDVDLRCGDQ